MNAKWLGNLLLKLRSWCIVYVYRQSQQTFKEGQAFMLDGRKVYNTSLFLSPSLPLDLLYLYPWFGVIGLGHEPMGGRSFGHHPLVHNHFLTLYNGRRNLERWYICPMAYFEARSFVDVSKRIVEKTTKLYPTMLLVHASSTNDEVHWQPLHGY